MNSKEKAAKIKRQVEFYNMIPNLFWSILNFTPVAVFCYYFMTAKWLYISIALSLFPYLILNKFFNNISLGKSIAVYNKIGIRMIRKYAQGGDLINKIIRKKYPSYRVIQKNKSTSNYINKTYFLEKFHYAAFVFFLFAAIYAIIPGYVLWAAVITIKLFLIYTLFFCSNTTGLG